MQDGGATSQMEFLSLLLLSFSSETSELESRDDSLGEPGNGFSV